MGGEDTTLSVTRSIPKELQLDEVTKAYGVYKEDGAKRLMKCVLEHRQTVTTRYTIKNNGTRRVPCLYIEHTARTDRGGFAITSKEHCVKQTTGWSRYCLAVEAEAEVILDVTEEVSYEENLSMNDAEIAKFLAVRATSFCQRGILNEELVNSLKDMLGRLRLSALLTALIRPQAISEEQLLSWEQRDCPWSVEPCNGPEAAADTVRALLKQVQEMQSLEQQKKELQRKQSVDNSRVQKIFENQARLRENIKSMEHVRTGSLLDRYMTDMDKEESDLIETRSRVEAAEEKIATVSQDVAKIGLQITMKAKQVQKQFCS